MSYWVSTVSCFASWLNMNDVDVDDDDNDNDADNK